jgi:hypothetical protein
VTDWLRSWLISQNHGYDNDESSMHAIFVADGPFATLLKKRENAAFRRKTSPGKGPLFSVSGIRFSRPLRRILQSLSGSWLSGSEGAAAEARKEPQTIEQFDNVEIYGLIVKLLNLDKFAAPNNGTPGFWDRYLDGDD